MAEKPDKKDYRGWQEEDYKRDVAQWESNPLYGLSLIHIFLRLVLLLLLAGVLRSGLTFLQRLFQVLCRLVGLALVVHRHLRCLLYTSFCDCPTNEEYTSICN